eukprot:6201615-Pleurochrysis_carterae.AAC.6
MVHIALMRACAAILLFSYPLLQYPTNKYTSYVRFRRYSVFRSSGRGSKVPSILAGGICGRHKVARVVVGCSPPALPLAANDGVNLSRLHRGGSEQRLSELDSSSARCAAIWGCSSSMMRMHRLSWKYSRR